ncbi:MAG: DUF1569 domain-containing protein [Crocinitomicaceae bacterium]|nr:DUF1569 domain-containing protein [Crocinitomicaceae bacterium]
MPFIEPKLDLFLKALTNLSSDSKPEWGKMSATRMVEHLSDSLDLAMGNLHVELEIPEEKIEGALRFLHSDKPMPRNFKINFAPEEKAIRNKEIELAIDEFSEKWIQFEEYFSQNNDSKTLHPIYGDLDYSSWLVLHAKHFTHHFEQFGIS